MTAQELKTFEQKLLAEKKDIEEQIKKLGEELDFGDDVDSLEEETDETEEFANRLGVRNVLEKRVEEIENALRKMGKNEYGICEKCRKEIEVKLLEVNPESRLCRLCKQK